MPVQSTAQDLALPDVPSDAATWQFGGTDRIDVTVLNGNDVRLEVRGPYGPWEETKPIRVSGNSFRSLTGLALAYPPRGVLAFRLSNWNPGAVAIVDVDAYSTG